jgi:hypothetical protein
MLLIKEELPMAKVPPYHTDSPEVPPNLRFIYHDHDDCPLGMRIRPEDRKPGMAVRPHCQECHSLG